MSTVTVRFTRLHTCPILKGIKTHDSITFVSEDRAREWIGSINKHWRRNGYKVIGHTIEPSAPVNNHCEYIHQRP